VLAVGPKARKSVGIVAFNLEAAAFRLAEEADDMEAADSPKRQTRSHRAAVMAEVEALREGAGSALVEGAAAAADVTSHRGRVFLRNTAGVVVLDERGAPKVAAEGSAGFGLKGETPTLLPLSFSSCGCLVASVSSLHIF
jgi:hypothetical protein